MVLVIFSSDILLVIYLNILIQLLIFGLFWLCAMSYYPLHPIAGNQSLVLKVVLLHPICIISVLLILKTENSKISLNSSSLEIIPTLILDAKTMSSTSTMHYAHHDLVLDNMPTEFWWVRRYGQCKSMLVTNWLMSPPIVLQ